MSWQPNNNRTRNVWIFQGPVDLELLSDLNLRGSTVVFNAPSSLADLEKLNLKDTCLIINPQGPSAENVPHLLRPIRDSLNSMNARVESFNTRQSRRNERAEAEGAEVEEGATADEGGAEDSVGEPNEEAEQEMKQEEEVEVEDEESDEDESDEKFYDTEDGKRGVVEMEAEVEEWWNAEEGDDKHAEVKDNLVARARRLGYFLVTGK